jgi:putative transposase
MEYLMRGKGAMIQWLPEAKRRTLCLMQSAHRCRVRGYLPQGIRPHINLFQVRYTSPALAGTGALLGQELRVYYNSEDLRTVRAFLADGSELGVLKAQGAWGEVRHDLKLRREIMKLRARKRLSAAISEDVIEQYLESTKAKAKRSRRAATELARAVRVLSKAPITTTPAPAPVSSATPAAVDESAESAAQKKIKPVKLTIGTGFASGSDCGS